MSTKNAGPDSEVIARQLLSNGPAVPGIGQHEGKKYLAEIHAADQHDPHVSVNVDVYAVIEAYGVACPARAQAVKKLLMAGRRGKGDTLADLVGAQAAVSRAIELQRVRDEKGKS